MLFNITISKTDFGVITTKTKNVKSFKGFFDFVKDYVPIVDMRANSIKASLESYYINVNKVGVIADYCLNPRYNITDGKGTWVVIKPYVPSVEQVKE